MSQLDLSDAAAGPADRTSRCSSEASADRLSAGYFDTMAEVARTHWWYRNRRAWLTELLRAHGHVDGRAVDVGCGTGETLAALEELGYDRPVGTDLSAYVLDHARRRCPQPMLRSLAEELPFADASVACLTSMDVLEHVADDRAALAEFRRVLVPGGLAVLMVPAYQWLFGDHDVRACHHRRYSARDLEALVAGAGFTVERVSYLHSFLVPPAAALRRTPLRRLHRGTDEEVSTGPAGLDRALQTLARWERRVGRARRIPFGLSIALVARRADRSAPRSGAVAT